MKILFWLAIIYFAIILYGQLRKGHWSPAGWTVLEIIGIVVIGLYISSH